MSELGSALDALTADDLHGTNAGEQLDEPRCGSRPRRPAFSAGRARTPEAGAAAEVATRRRGRAQPLRTASRGTVA
jgi:hypothetical protein